MKIVKAMNYGYLEYTRITKILESMLASESKQKGQE